MLSFRYIVLLLIIPILILFFHSGLVPRPTLTPFQPLIRIPNFHFTYNITKWPVELPSHMNTIFNETLGFGRILVINMPSRADKRDKMSLAASFTGIDFDYIDGVAGEAVPEKARPWFEGPKPITTPFFGSWRAHENAIRTVVEEGWRSALILEDDVDWDIRLHDQLAGFAVGARLALGEDLQDPQITPHGGNWDVLWLGHCSHRDAIEGVAQYTLPHDPTTLSKANYYDQFWRDTMIDWKEHSRKIYIANHPVCSFAYAVSQRGARKILWSTGIKEMREHFDVDLRNWCEDPGSGAVCLSTTPPYFVSHIPRGKAVKMSDNDPALFKDSNHSHTPNIRLSVMNNLDKLIRGDDDLTDYFPDELPRDSVVNPY